MRNRQTFMVKIAKKDEVTQTVYRIAIDNFLSFHPGDMRKLKSEKIYDILQKWVNSLTLSPATIRLYFGKIRKYLYHIGIKLNPQDIEEEITFPQKITETKYGMTLSDVQTITGNMLYKHKTFFICQLSSMMRVGEMVQLRKKDMEIGDIIKVDIPSHIAKLKKARTTYFSAEAGRLLRPLLKKLNEDDLVFGTNKNKFSSKSNIQQVLRHALKRIGLDKKKGEAQKFHQINTHSFRSYGITRLTRHDPGITKKIAGQKGYLDEYDRTTEAERFEFYLKHQGDLIIDDAEKQKIKITKLEEDNQKINELEKKIDEFDRVTKATAKAIKLGYLIIDEKEDRIMLRVKA